MVEGFFNYYISCAHNIVWAHAMFFVRLLYISAPVRA